MKNGLECLVWIVLSTRRSIHLCKDHALDVFVDIFFGNNLVFEGLNPSSRNICLFLMLFAHISNAQYGECHCQQGCIYGFAPS